jgi:hypothetical protein
MLSVVMLTVVILSVLAPVEHSPRHPSVKSSSPATTWAVQNCLSRAWLRLPYRKHDLHEGRKTLSEYKFSGDIC